MGHYRSDIEGASKNVAESRIEAYKWFHLAEAQAYFGAASACETVNLRMTREEVTEGNLRAALYVRDNPIVSIGSE